MRTLATLLAIVASAFIVSSATPDKACASGYCGTAPCLDSGICLSDCVCIRQPPELGYCASIN